MGKSIRSKIKKRFRTAKRQRVNELIRKPQVAQSYQDLVDVANGVKKVTKQTINKFMYPDHPDAEVPQFCIKKPIDFRCENLPMAGYAFRGNRRKYTEEEQEDRLVRSEKHPPIEIIAGKGFVPKMEVDEPAGEEQEVRVTVEDLGMDEPAGADFSAGKLPKSMMMPKLAPHDASDHTRIPIKKKKKENKTTRSDVLLKNKK